MSFLQSVTVQRRRLAFGTELRWPLREVKAGVLLAVAFLGILAIAAVAPGLLTREDPLAVTRAGPFIPPFESFDHILGTDQSGRDVYARMVYGARPSLGMGLGATALGVAGGVIVGLAAGLGNRILESLIMRLVDVALAIPDLLLALVVISILGSGLVDSLIAVGVAAIPHYARMIRVQAQVVRRSAYVEAAGLLGVTPLTVIWRHVLPNAVKPVVVLATLGIGRAIAAGASLSFLGLGAKPPEAEWGSMLSSGIAYIHHAFVLPLIPGATITLTVLAVTIVGRDLKRRSEGRAA